jgi:hypothetical protein
LPLDEGLEAVDDDERCAAQFHNVDLVFGNEFVEFGPADAQHLRCHRDTHGKQGKIGASAAVGRHQRGGPLRSRALANDRSLRRNALSIAGINSTTGSSTP